MLLNQNLWFADVHRTLATLPELSELAGKTVLITGAAGLVCSPIIDLLIVFNETHCENIQILAAGRHPETIRRRFGAYSERPYFHILRYDAARDDTPLPSHCDYIVHGAGNARPDLIVNEPVETMLGNILGTHRLLNYAKTAQVRRFLYISSSEVYGKKEGLQPYRETDYGSVNLLTARSSYASAKRAAETLCVSYAEEYQLESVIVRPGHIYGPSASPKDMRVGSAWAYAASRGENLVMKSDGKQLRSYCFCLDCAAAIGKVLLLGETAQAYNISNPNSILSIRELGELYSAAGGVKLIQEQASATEKKEFNPMQNSSLDSTRLQDLGWKGLFSAKEGVSHTIQILRGEERGE